MAGLPLPVTSGPGGSSANYDNTAYPPNPNSFSSSSSTIAPPPFSRNHQTALERLLKGKGKSTESNSRDDTRSPFDYSDDGIDLEAGITAGPRGLSFCIRFTAEGVEDLLDLWVGEKESVREVKRRMRLLRPGLNIEGKPRRLRLIQLGRILTDGTYLVDYVVKLNNRRAKLVNDETKGTGTALYEELEAVGRNIGVGGLVVNVEKDVKGKGKEKEAWESNEGEVEEKIWLNCSVGEVMDDDEIDGEKVQTDQITPLEGFDRLRDAGFSETEINEMRAEFRSSNANSLPAEGADDAEHSRALEEQWMQGLTQTEATDNSTSAGLYMTLLQGVSLAFFFPFLPLFFFRTQIFSKRMQMACVLGICLNGAFGLLRFFS